MVIIDNIQNNMEIIDKLKYRLGPKYRRSYSQCGEDIIVSRLLRDMKISRPFYIDIGANDPVVYNNTYLFYRNGARGICIEPNPVLYSRIRHKRPNDKCLPVGIGTTNSNMDFYTISNDALSTFSSKDAEAAVREGFKIIKKQNLPVMTLSHVLAENNVDHIDFLSIDVEGLDFDILKSVDFSSIRPKVICVETKSFSGPKDQSSVTAFMETRGYKLAGCTPINSIYTLSS